MTVPIRMPTNNVATTKTVDKNRCDLIRSRSVMCECMIFPHQRLANLNYSEKQTAGRTLAARRFLLNTLTPDWLDACSAAIDACSAGMLSGQVRSLCICNVWRAG